MIKSEVMFKYYIYNGKSYNTDELDIFDKISKPVIYEVIRAIDKKPLYLKEHIHRLRKSSKLLGHKINRCDDDINKDILELINLNKVSNQNIKILCSNLDENIQTFIIYFINSNYPDMELYKEGIHTIMLNEERKNPNIKAVNTSFKEIINGKLKESNAYEAILVNEKGHITEGSRSNIFFIKDNKIYTSPGEEILLGVTRDKIIKICKEHNIEVKEDFIYKDELNQYDAVFMTGTSVNVLPISSIDNIKYNSVSNLILNKVSDGYLNDVRDDLLSLI